MNTMTGTFTDGHVVLDRPADWPDGTRLKVEPRPPFDDDQPMTAEEVEDWFKWYDSLEPIEMTEEEIAELRDWRNKLKQYEIAHADDRIIGLFP